MIPIKRLYDITCEECGNAFISGQRKSKWCGDPCREAALKKKWRAKAKEREQKPAQIAKRKDAAGTKKKGRKVDSDFNKDWLSRAL